MEKEKIIVGLSGGVDSSVSALLLQEQGFDVEGLFMKNWDEKTPDGECMWEADVEDALRVCDKVGIPLNTVDLSLDYWDSVFNCFLDEYKKGRTPNPDILCNQEIKFKAFLNHAFKFGAEKIATGHYSRIARNTNCQLLKGIDTNKDQSYFLCRLNQDQLKNTLFPIGELDKPSVRKIAEKAGLATHDKKDSTGICFVGERHFREFLGRYIPKQTGDIRTCDEKTIGEHDGIYFYTLGQRQGLGIGGIKGVGDEPWYVVDKDIEHNILYVGQGQDHPRLFSTGLSASSLHWIAGFPPGLPLACTAKTRYRQPDQSCVIESITDTHCNVSFTEPQRAVTPGQYVVFYQDDICLGGAIIEKTTDVSTLSH